MLKYFVALVLFGIILALVYIRLAPVDTARFHIAPEPRTVGDYSDAGSFTVVREVTDSQINVMGALNFIILKTPRTRRVAGDLGTALLTYETRSAAIGFPDYATVSFIQSDTIGNDTPLLVIESRLRFGVYDMDVNKARVLGWLDELGPLTVAP